MREVRRGEEEKGAGERRGWGRGKEDKRKEREIRRMRG